MLDSSHSSNVVSEQVDSSSSAAELSSLYDYGFETTYSYSGSRSSGAPSVQVCFDDVKDVRDALVIFDASASTPYTATKLYGLPTSSVSSDAWIGDGTMECADMTFSGYYSCGLQAQCVVV